MYLVEYFVPCVCANSFVKVILKGSSNGRPNGLKIIQKQYTSKKVIIVRNRKNSHEIRSRFSSGSYNVKCFSVSEIPKLSVVCDTTRWNSLLSLSHRILGDKSVSLQYFFKIFSIYSFNFFSRNKAPIWTLFHLLLSLSFSHFFSMLLGLCATKFNLSREVAVRTSLLLIEKMLIFV